MKLLVHSIQGPENSVNAVFPIAIASMAAEAGHEVSIFLAGNAVSLMKTEIVDNMSAIGVGKLSDFIKIVKDKGIKIHLSTGNCKARGITEDDVIDKNGVMSGPPGLLKLTEEAEKILSY
ncbi:DsrE family protein [Candidatus Pelagibacter sp.]|nr:DsrE family protein [Candidatus Pelagibacter sp.]